MRPDHMRVSEAANYLGVHPGTLRKYTREGRLSYTLSPAGHRIFRLKDLESFKQKYEVTHVIHDNETELTSEPVEDKPIIAFYTRESDGGKTALANQYEELVTHYGEPNFTYTDSASGLNEARKGLKKLLNDARGGKFTDLYITNKDRLTRFGFTYLETLLNEYGVTVHVVDNTHIKTPEEELMQDFMSLIASYSGRFYRLRSNKHKRELLERALNEIPANTK